MSCFGLYDKIEKPHSLPKEHGSSAVEKSAQELSRVEAERTNSR